MDTYIIHFPRFQLFVTTTTLGLRYRIGLAHTRWLYISEIASEARTICPINTYISGRYWLYSLYDLDIIIVKTRT